MPNEQDAEDYHLFLHNTGSLIEDRQSKHYLDAPATSLESAL